MAIVQSRYPRHIIYMLAAMAAAAALAALAACSESEPSTDGSGLGPSGRQNAAEKATSEGRDPTPAASPASSPTPPRSVSPSAAHPPSATLGRDPATSATASDPDASGFHLDDPEVEYDVPRRPPRSRKGRPIEVVLRSSPPGAVAAVDGVTIGPTPAIWEGAADAVAHEFTFVLPGYAIARYRFVPTQSGIVHGTLESLKNEAEESDAGEAGPAAGHPAPRPVTR